MPAWAWIFEKDQPDVERVMIALAVSALLIITRHHENIRRLISGTESKFGSAGKR
jgi:glycerol-3-phosphate acyltransferase PlsY